MFGGMGKIAFNLTDDDAAWVDAQANADGFETAADYIADLLARERERERVEGMAPFAGGPSFSTREELDRLLEEGLNSGPSIPADQVLAKIDAMIAARKVEDR